MTCLTQEDQARLKARRSPESFEDQTLLQVDRILASQTFKRVREHLQNVLVLVTERALLDPADRIKELEIGMLLYNEDYNPGDNTVREAVKRLRNKLSEYYAVEGRNDPIKISIRKGTYVPDIQDRRISIGVRPFANWNLNEEQDYLCVALTNDIVHRLTKIPNVQTRRLSADDPVRNHDFKYELRGLFRSEREKMKVTILLDNCFSGARPCDSSFRAGLDDVFKLSQQVVDAIIAALAPDLRPQKKQVARALSPRRSLRPRTPVKTARQSPGV